MLDMQDQEHRRSRHSSFSEISATSSDNEDPDKVMFAKKEPYVLSIIKRFDFDSKLARMSVLVKNKKDQKYKLYIKGAPENIRRL